MPHKTETGIITSGGDMMRLPYTLYSCEAEDAQRVVLVHSLGLDWTLWQPVAELLADKATVVLYDCRGHGAATKDPGPYSAELFADDLLALLDGLGWAHAVVAGASMGGVVAQALAASNPGRVSALGLVDTTAWYGEGAAERWADRAREAREKGLASLVDFQLGRWFSDAFRARAPEAVKHATDVFLANHVEAYAASCILLGEFDLRESNTRVRVPTAVIVGEQDYATPVEMAQQIHESIPGSTLNVLSGARHLSPMEQPETLASLLDGLLQRVAS